MIILGIPEQQMIQHTLSPWYATYLPGVLAYLAGVACSYGGTQMVKMVYSTVLSKRELRLFAFIIGFAATSYVWWLYYGFGHVMIMAGVMAGVTAPVVWASWRSWLGRKSKSAGDDPMPPDDQTDPMWRDE